MFLGAPAGAPFAFSGGVPSGILPPPTATELPVCRTCAASPPIGTLRATPFLETVYVFA